MSQCHHTHILTPLPFFFQNVFMVEFFADENCFSKYLLMPQIQFYRYEISFIQFKINSIKRSEFFLFVHFFYSGKSNLKMTVAFFFVLLLRLISSSSSGFFFFFSLFFFFFFLSNKAFRFC